MFVCTRQDCPDRPNLPLYCALCAKTHHDHRSLLISNELVQHTEMWHALKQKIDSLYNHVTTVYSQLQPLILYLENAMMQPGVELDKQISWITVVHREVIDLNKGFKNFFTNKV